MSSIIFSTPASIRSVIIEDVCAFSVSGLLSKTVLDQLKIDPNSQILILATELHPAFPSSTQAWVSLLQTSAIEYQFLLQDQQIENGNEDTLLTDALSKIEKFCDENKTGDTILITNLTPLLLTNSPSKVTRLLGKSILKKHIHVISNDEMNNPKNYNR